MKYEYLKLEEEDVRTELTKYILDFEKHFKKYYDESVRLNSQKKSSDIDEAPDFDLLEREFEKRRLDLAAKRKNLKAKSKRLKSLYKKLSSITHPDVSGDDETFLRVKSHFEKGEFADLVSIAEEYNVEFELGEDEIALITKSIEHIESEINRMKNTLAWGWGSGDLNAKKQIIKIVEQQTKIKVSVEDYPDELKPEPIKEIKLIGEPGKNFDNSK
jgi:hypothetical protein